MTILEDLLPPSLKKVDTTELLEGVLLAQKVYLDGRVETCFNNSNLITLATKQKMLATIYQQATFTTDPITYLRVGLGGTIDPNGFYPKTPSQNLTALYQDLLGVAVSYTLDATIPSVKFIADLDTSTGNGNLITEAGLYTSAGTLFNIKTFPGIPKTSEFGLHFEWTIKLA